MLAFLFSPSGRFGRAQWWLAHLIILIIASLFILLALTQLSGDDGFKHLDDRRNRSIGPILAMELLAFAIVLLWITFCVAAKRYHDRGKSAWWYLIQFIPIIGGIWALVELGFCSGDDGDNEYGDGPDLNIGEDLKALREMGGQQTAVSATSPYSPASAPRTSGPPVFGKRG